MNNLEFALEMKNKRLASGLSQGELASLTHVSRYSINRFENGKANASKETQNIILRCLNYYICDKPFYLLVDYLSVRYPTTDALEIIRKVLGMKADYFIHYDYGYYGYKEHYAYGEIKVMASDDEHMGVFLELKGAGSRNMEYVLQAQNRDWYSFLNRCLDCDGVIRRFDLGTRDVDSIAPPWFTQAVVDEKVFIDRVLVDGHIDVYGCTIETLEGKHRAKIGDYIIRGVAGELYPCKSQIFQKTYEKV